LTIIVNTGDDFTHLGLWISPDLDTVCYTLAGMANPETGWGRINESWKVFESLKKLGMADWFQLGDTDLATHIVRSVWLKEGRPLSQITHDFCQLWDLHVNVLPMSDDPVQTWVYTDEGDFEFQEYFVHYKCKPIVRGFKFVGVEKSSPAPGVVEAIEKCDVVILCPSNPWVSIDPILAVPGLWKAIQGHLTIAVSPIIGATTVKGPAAKMFAELGIQPSALAVAQHYGSLIHSIVIDNSDNLLAQEITKLGVHPFLTNILMHERQDRGRLATEIITYISRYVRG
jgi:LPPG:FO 2-phospho-L-lactate transferase